MKYSVEYKDGQFIETLEVDNNVVTKTWKREENEALSGLCTKDNDFSEQLEELVDEDVAERIYDIFDQSMLVADVEDFVRDFDVE